MPIAAIVAALLPYIPTVITTVEAVIGAKKGKEKAHAAVKMTEPLVEALKNQGKIPQNIDSATVGAIVETVFQMAVKPGPTPVTVEQASVPVTQAPITTAPAVPQPASIESPLTPLKDASGRTAWQVNGVFYGNIAKVYEPNN